MTEHAPPVPVVGMRPRNRNVRKDLRLVARNVAAIALTLPFLYPFYFLVITAFKSNQGYAENQLGLPHPFVFTQFSSAWDSGSLSRQPGLYLRYAYRADAVPGALREAATVAGAKPRHIFFMISLPISLPVLVTIAVLAFVWSWGDVLIAAVLLQSQQDWTVTLSA